MPCFMIPVNYLYMQKNLLFVGELSAFRCSAVFIGVLARRARELVYLYEVGHCRIRRLPKSPRDGFLNDLPVLGLLMTFSTVAMMVLKLGIKRI